MLSYPYMQRPPANPRSKLQLPPILPSAFRNKFISILKNETAVFFPSLLKPLRDSLHVNTLKAQDAEILQFLRDQNVKHEKIPFLEHAYWIDSNFEAVSKSMEHHTGLFEIMSSSAMIPAVVLNPSKDDRVLDMTAAPGNKSILLAQLMQNQGTLVVNELDGLRLKRLRANLNKAGVQNALVANQDAAQFDLGIKFNKILLDAPCSSEAEVNKNKGQLNDWNMVKVFEFQALQKKLILHAADLLEPEGELVYSTCTFSPEENEEVIDFILAQRPNLHTVSIKLKKLKYTRPLRRHRGKLYPEQMINCLRIWPHKQGMEGFFVCKLQAD